MKAKKAVSLMLGTVLAAAMLTGCGGGRGTEETDQTADTPDDTKEPDDAEGTEDEKSGDEETGGTSSAEGGIVGVALPWLGTQNWAEAEVMFKEQLEAA